MTVKSVKVWTGKNGEERVYIKDDRGFESVIMVTGNNFDKPGTIKKQGKWGVSDETIQEAKSLALTGEYWTNYPATSGNSGRWVCPECGDPRCQGPNCTSNR